jgi:hypothetical protein
VLTQVVAADPAVSALLQARGAKSEIMPAEANEQASRLLHRVLAVDRNL